MSSTGPWGDKVRGMVAQTVRAEKRRWVWSQHVVLGEFVLPTRGQLWEGQPPQHHDTGSQGHGGRSPSRAGEAGEGPRGAVSWSSRGPCTSGRGMNARGCLSCMQAEEAGAASAEGLACGRSEGRPGSRSTSLAHRWTAT